MAVSPTVRAAVVRWVTEWYETHVVYRFCENMTGEMPQYDYRFAGWVCRRFGAKY